MRILVGTLLIVALLLAGGTAEARAPRIGETITSFQLPTLAGKTTDTGRYRGKTLVIYFWTDACGCREQLIELKSFIAGLKNRPFGFLAVNAGQERSKVERFITENRLPYEVLLDEKANVARNRFVIKVLPTIFVIGKDGVLREKVIGVVDSKKLEAIISRHL